VILDYAESTKAFCLYVDRGEADIRALMEEHGLDFSKAASTHDRAVLFTREPYSAVNFFRDGTITAMNQLGHIWENIQTSRALTSNYRTTYPDTQQFADEIGKPYQFQGAFIEYAMRRNGCLAGDEPGVGKTGEAVLLANE